MNLVGSSSRFSEAMCLLFAASLLFSNGCSDPRLATTQEMQLFQSAGPVRPTVDANNLVKAKSPCGPYCIVAGDVLEFQMPVVMRASSEQNTSSLQKSDTQLCRVSPSGTVSLPVIGDVPAAGKTLDEVEAAATAAYHPKYTVTRPTIVIRIVEYRTQVVSIVGAVKQPGAFPLRSDEMSLVTLMMKAGGVTQEGAGVIRIRHANATGEAEPLALPVKGLNIPFADIALKEGDVVEVERLNPQESLTVIGLVNKPGPFPYPPTIQFNLLQAIGFAGGLDQIAAPEYARIYRQSPSGELISIVLKLSGTGANSAYRTILRSGDVIDVEQTSATRARLILAKVFRFTTGINAGAFYNINSSDNNNN